VPEGEFGPNLALLYFKNPITLYNITLYITAPTPTNGILGMFKKALLIPLRTVGSSAWCKEK